MSLKTRQVLDVLKASVDTAVEGKWKTHSTLRHSPKPEDVMTDFKVKDPDLGNVVKAIILMAADSRISRATTGGNGFSKRMRNIRIQAFIGVDIGSSKGAPDRILGDAIDAIVVELQKVSRIETESKGDTFHVGEMTVSPINSANVSNQAVLVQEIVTVVQDRILGRE